MEPQTVTVGSMSVTSSSETEDEIRQSIGAESTPDEVKEAAAELGRKGGKARAEKLKAAKAEKPEPGEAAEVESSDDEPEKAAKSDKAAKADEKSEKPLGKPRDDPRARMLEATQKEAAAKREARERAAEAQRLAQENAQLRERLESLSRGETPEKGAPARQEARGAPAGADDDPEPKEEDFEAYNDYVKANARWEARQEWKSLEAKRAREAKIAQAQGEIKERAVAFADRMEKAQESGLEFKEEFLSNFLEIHPASLVPPQYRRPLHYLAEEVWESEYAPQLIHHLQENKDVLQRLATLPPDKIVREIARIEAKFGSDAATTATASKPYVGKAPHPVRPVTGAPTVAKEGLGDDSSLGDHVNAWRARVRGRRASA